MPNFSINLDDPPETRWNSLAMQYKEELNNLFEYISGNHVQYDILLNNDSTNNLGNTFPEPYRTEISGMSNSTNLLLKYFMLFNSFYEISIFLCSSIVAEDLNGKIYHSRNLDFGFLLGWDSKNDTWMMTQLLRKLMVNIDFYKNGKLSFKSSTFVGYVGILTGLKPSKYSITLNRRNDDYPGILRVIEWINGYNRDSSWDSLLVREVLENENIDFNGAVKILSDQKLLVSVYYIVAGPNTSQGVVITRNFTDPIDVWFLGTNNSWFIAQTNYDHWKQPSAVDDRITPIYDCMNKMGRENLSFSGLFDVLSTQPVLNKLTIHTALIELESSRYETYFQECLTPCALF